MIRDSQKHRGSPKGIEVVASRRGGPFLFEIGLELWNRRAVHGLKTQTNRGPRLFRRSKFYCKFGCAAAVRVSVWRLCALLPRKRGR